MAHALWTRASSTSDAVVAAWTRRFGGSCRLSFGVGQAPPSSYTAPIRESSRHGRDPRGVGCDRSRGRNTGEALFPSPNAEALMWFKHRAWIPIAWLLSLANLGAVWYAALPGEPWHATTHALLAVLFAVGAGHLMTR